MRRRQEQPLTDLPNEEGDCRPRGEWTQVAVAVHCRGPEWLHSLPSPWFRRPQDRLGLKPPQPQSAPPLNLLFTSAAIHAVLSLGGRPPHHTQRRNAPQMLLVDSKSLNTRTFSPRHPPCEPFLLSRSNLFAAKLPVAGHLISSRPPLGHRRGRCHENQKFPGPVSIPALVAGQPAITGRVPR